MTILSYMLILLCKIVDKKSTYRYNCFGDMPQTEVEMKKLSVPDIKKVSIDENGFFGRLIDLVRDKVIPYQWETLNDRVEGAAPSHCIENFRIAAGESQGEFYGCVFQDSDLAKWIEAVAYSLMTKPNPELEKTTDEVIDLIARAQQPDGYLNTYYTVKEPGKRWTNLRDNHELYCAGHMMEAAVAYYYATGKRKLLDVMTRMAYHIDSVIGPEEGKLHGYPGHEEIELALISMYGATKDPLMLKLAKYFIDERGREPKFFNLEAEKREGRKPRWEDRGYYAQWHLPVREQTALEGHAVRALYLATGMADVARETGDETLLRACETLFDNLIKRRMYITGGVGSTVHGEAFTFDYDLPNDTVYAETCASIALCFFARAMLQMKPDSKYADVLETALYNTCLAGMSLDGRNFFYVNPLEVWPEASHKAQIRRHVLPVRPKWFGCACCPPNLARLIASIGKYIYTIDSDRVYMNLYIDGESELDTASGSVKISVETKYPLDGEVKIKPSAGKYALCLRIPAYADGKYSISVNGKAYDAPVENGYAVLDREWSEGDVIDLSISVVPHRVYANVNVRADAGRVAVRRGPIVYCLEEADNGKPIAGLRLPRDAELKEEYKPDKLCGIVEITADGYAYVPDEDDTLYRTKPPKCVPAKLTFIPYYTWANRGEGEMSVYVLEQ